MAWPPGIFSDICVGTGRARSSSVWGVAGFGDALPENIDSRYFDPLRISGWRAGVYGDTFEVSQRPVAERQACCHILRKEGRCSPESSFDADDPLLNCWVCSRFLSWFEVGEGLMFDGA